MCTRHYGQRWNSTSVPTARRQRVRGINLGQDDHRREGIAVITDLGHPAFAAHDVDATLGFYKILGIEEAFRLNHDDGSLMLVYLHVSGDSFIEVFPGGPPPDPSREQSFEHICLLTDDMHAAVERLRQNGAPIDHEPLVGLDGNLQAWTHDPDGNQIELMQLSEESPQWQTARASENGTA
jgi:lactoylglutathione lyase